MVKLMNIQHIISDVFIQKRTFSLIQYYCQNTPSLQAKQLGLCHRQARAHHYIEINK